MTFCISIIFMIYPIKTTHMARKYRSRDYSETGSRRRLDIHRVENIINTPSGVMLYSQRTWNTRVGKSRIDTGERDAGLRSIHTRKYQAAPAAATKGCSSTSEKIGFRDFLPFSVCEFLFVRKNERRSFDEIFFSFLNDPLGMGMDPTGPTKRNFSCRKRVIKVVWNAQIPY